MSVPALDQPHQEHRKLWIWKLLTAVAPDLRIVWNEPLSLSFITRVVWPLLLSPLTPTQIGTVGAAEPEISESSTPFMHVAQL